MSELHPSFMEKHEKIRTLGQLKSLGFQSQSIKEELRKNVRAKLAAKEPIFQGIVGYEHTVIPEVERALLSKHNIIFLGLRGQAKTRMARLMVHLLDEYIPVVAESEIHDDPLRPLSKHARDLIAKHGNDTPIEWLHRSQRYVEKLATPDVSVADLIGDVDPIKAAALKLPYSDERVLHFGLIPRSNRCIFVINELPDLQARIQVALLNILQEGDLQIRGFTLRFPLDVHCVFTANPEDYTNRGSIITPLKDRIDSQILTHYPTSVALSAKITDQEAKPAMEQCENIFVPKAAKDIVEYIAVTARKSEYIDPKSGVSARLTISALENLYSAAERRALMFGEQKAIVRMSDVYALIPSITGKVELVYEGEQEGALKVARLLIGNAVRTLFPTIFPNPENIKRNAADNPFSEILNWFSLGNSTNVFFDMPENEYRKNLDNIIGLKTAVEQYIDNKNSDETYFFMELLLHGLAEYSLIGKYTLESNQLPTGTGFADFMRTMLSMDEGED